MKESTNKLVDTIRTIKVEWNDYKAEYMYSVDILIEYENGERRKTGEFGGDLAWITRIAAHYNLIVPATPEV